MKGPIHTICQKRGGEQWHVKPKKGGSIKNNAMSNKQQTADAEEWTNFQVSRVKKKGDQIIFRWEGVKKFGKRDLPGH